METKIQKIITILDLESIKSTTGMVVMISKIIQNIHSKNKLSYDDSKQLISLVIDIIIKNKDINPQLVEDLEKNKENYMVLVSEFIDIWNPISEICKSCCNWKKEPNVRSSMMA